MAPKFTLNVTTLHETGGIDSFFFEAFDIDSMIIFPTPMDCGASRPMSR